MANNLEQRAWDKVALVQSFAKTLDAFELAAINRYHSFKREGDDVTVNAVADAEYQALRKFLIEAFSVAAG